MAVEHLARMMGMEMDTAMLQKIQALEVAQLNRWAEERARMREEAKHGR